MKDSSQYLPILIVILIVIPVLLMTKKQKDKQQELVNESSSNQSMTTSANKPDLIINPNKEYSAVMHTNMGDITISLDAKNKPVTVNNFVKLAQGGFYNSLTFHRIVDGFMIQGGDPNGDGTGGPGYTFKDELNSPNANNKWTIAMANAGPDTNGSQFFINLIDNNFLDDKHTVFGEVSAGTDVVEKISEVEVQVGPSGEESMPITPVIINAIDISD